MKKHETVLALSAATLLVGSACASQERGVTTTTLPATGGSQVVIAGPVRGEVQHTLVGKVTDVDRNRGDLTVETQEGVKMRLKLPPVALASVQEGDRVALNLSITPPR
jgi:hypothetical protein